MKIKQAQRNVLIAYLDVDNRSKFEQWLLLTGDRHHDNPLCDRKLEKQHLELAKERNALIIDCGDLFCAMQGKYDPRSSMDDIRQEDVGEDYLDRIVKNAANFYGPYAKNILMLGHGNHETNVRHRHGVDLTSNLVHRLNTEYGGSVRCGHYAGYVMFRFSGNKTETKVLKYHHGAGGGGPVTKGVISTNRQAVYLPDAHIVLNGHTHDEWVLPLARERVSQRGKTSRDLIWFCRTAGYKDDFNDGASGYHVENWRPPKPLGAIWVRFYYRNNNIEIEAIQDLKQG